MALNDDMVAVFKSVRAEDVPENTIGVDPVSGNEVPLGSSPEEVRDDIEANLSENEYVVPADVVRYYGVKFFEDLRAGAKFGYRNMAENGRIGGEPISGMEIVEPEDDIEFDISELEVMDTPDGPSMDEGGMVAGFDDGGALGLGSEGLGLGSGVQAMQYQNSEGHTIWIMFMNGEPMQEIPDGYYPVGSEPVVVEPEEPEESEVVTDDGGDGGPDIEPPEPVDYTTLTMAEMNEMLEEQETLKPDAIAAGLGMINPIMGIAVKLAMADQARRLENEIERRLEESELTAQQRANYESMLNISKSGAKGLMGKLFGKDKKKPEMVPEEVEPTTTPTEPYSPEAKTVDKSSVDDAVKEAMAYTAETEAPYVPSITDEMVEEAQKAAAEAGAKVFGTVSTPSKPITPMVGDDDDNPVMAARRSARQGTQDVLDRMREEGAGRSARTAALKEGARIENVVADQARGVQRGFKKGGLASKKKK